MYNKRPRPDAIRPATDQMAGATFSVFGADVAIKGDVTATADLHIDGKVEGDIACASLVQGEASRITGAVTAKVARLAGTLTGTVTAGELTILKTARIDGDVFYEVLVIEQGARVEGRFAQKKDEPRLVVAN